MNIRIYLTGRLALESERNLIFDESRLRGRQSRLLFACLVYNRGRAISRGELAGSLWTDELPAAWDSSMSALISRLKALFATVPTDGSDSWLASAAGEYILRLPPETWIDLEATGPAIDEAEGALRAGRPEKAWASANVAATIGKRRFLPGFDGEWIESIRDRLDRQHVRALECLAHVWLERGETAAAIEAASQAIAVDSYRETSYQLLMRAYAAAGNRAEGVLAYKRLQKRLREDLGIEPSPESEAAYRRLG